jgi:hypothetical protein
MKALWIPLPVLPAQEDIPVDDPGVKMTDLDGCESAVEVGPVELPCGGFKG